jgi:hypothetical protein
MEAMERYWDLAYDQFFADGPAENGQDALPAAREAQRALQGVSAHALRNPDRLRSFVALADAMVLTCRQASSRATAARPDEEGQREEALRLLAAAKRDAERIVSLLATGPYDYLPKSMFWRDLWTIGKRAATIGQEAAQVRATGEWQPVAVPDGDFRQRSWSVAEVGKVEWIEDPQRGGVAGLDNSQAEGQWSALASPPIAANPSAPFRITFATKRTGKGGIFWAQWLNADGAELGPRLMIGTPVNDRWHEATLKGITPAVGPGEKMRLRFVLVWPAREALIANLRLFQKPSLAP